ncbi:lipopolysaccharide export system protein LptA [Haloferula luteola]|uniref:Lipopolysaccharide export system protein LptA n=1 Tax=Haloferula luteola TaxID=595692 RepID=A0A840VIE2_9BACT|nr:hypothetical protein [Haloferula luteola]MBB5353610.1 lipopolysaccharide export system protein LptA [Haloferula luteola]
MSLPLHRHPLCALGFSSLVALAILGNAEAQMQMPGFPSGPKDDDSMDLPGMEMLVDGSILEKVLIPRYNPQRVLVSTLRAEKLLLVNDQQIEATTARIEFYHPDETVRGRIDLKTATLEKGNLLRSHEPVDLVSEDLKAHGVGLIYQLKPSCGLLLGPATAVMRTPEKSKETSMNSRTPLLSAAGALMLASTAPAQDAEPERLDPAAVEGLNRLAASSAPIVEARNQEDQKALASTQEKVAQAGASLDEFLAKAAADLPPGKPADLQSDVSRPDLHRLDNLAKVSADDGIYFNSEKGIMILLKNVIYDHPEFKLSGADEVKVFFSNDSNEGGGQDKPSEGDLSVDFGEPTKVVAVGALVLEQKATDGGKKPAKASGRQMIYDVENEEFIIRGGRPWIISEGANGYVDDPEGYIRYNIRTGIGSSPFKFRAFTEGKALNKRSSDQ